MLSLLTQLLTLRIEDQLALRHAFHQASDLPSLFTYASRQGLAGSLLHRARHVGALLPELLQRELDEQDAVASLWTTHLCQQRDRLASTLRAGNVQCLFLKGPTLAERFYASPHHRPCVDFDVLVAPADLARTQTALVRLGYRALAPALPDESLPAHHHVILIHPDELPVELHFAATSSFGVTIPAAPLLERSQLFVPESGEATRVLSPADELVYLAVHGAGHRFVRLGWLYDLYLLLPTLSAGDIRLAHRYANDFAVTSVFRFTLTLVERIFGSCTLPRYIEVPDFSAAGRAAYRWLTWVNGRAQTSVQEALATFMFSALLCDSLPNVWSLAQKKFLHDGPRRWREHLGGMSDYDRLPPEE